MIEEHIKTMLPLLDEKQKRLFMASLAKEYGRGGVKKVCETSGCSPHTAIKGKKNLKTALTEKIRGYAKTVAGAKNWKLSIPGFRGGLKNRYPAAPAGTPKTRWHGQQNPSALRSRPFYPGMGFMFLFDP